MSRLIMTAVALALLCAACAGMRGSSRAETFTVEVVNENYYAARVHAVYAGGQRRSLGTIAGNGGHISTSLPWEPQSLVFEVLLVTEGSTYVSHSMDAVAGESIELRIPLNIAGSGFFRRVSRE